MATYRSTIDLVRIERRSDGRGPFYHWTHEPPLTLPGLFFTEDDYYGVLSLWRRDLRALGKMHRPSGFLGMSEDGVHYFLAEAVALSEAAHALAAISGGDFVFRRETFWRDEVRIIDEHQAQVRVGVQPARCEF